MPTESPLPRRGDRFLVFGVLFSLLSFVFVLIVNLSATSMQKDQVTGVYHPTLPIGFMLTFTINYPAVTRTLNMSRSFFTPAWEYHWALNRVCANTIANTWLDELPPFCYSLGTYSPAHSFNIPDLIMDEANQAHTGIPFNIATYILNNLSSSNNAASTMDIPSAPTFVALALGAGCSVAAAGMVVIFGWPRHSAVARTRAKDAEWMIVAVSMWAIVFYIVGSAYAATRISEIINFLDQPELTIVVESVTWGSGFQGLTWGAVSSQVVATLAIAWHCGLADVLVWRCGIHRARRPRERSNRRHIPLPIVDTDEMAIVGGR